MNDAQSHQKPQIEINPTYLDFGTLDLEEETHPIGVALILIKNTGYGVLAGTINPQYEWVEITPDSFQLSSEQTGEFNVSITSEVPRSAKWHNTAVDNLLFIHSNAGSLSVGGSYLAPPSHSVKTPFSPRQVILWLSAVVLVFAMLLVSGIVALASRPAAVSNYVDELYTQGAETVIASLTRGFIEGENQPVLESTETFQIRVTIEVDQLSELEEVTPIPTMTFTPWPRDQYPNPEQFVTDYYDGINNRNYEATWNNLTSAFQNNCCSIAGNNPFLVYVNWWDSVEQVEVLSAYIQDWNANPAVVHAQVRYHYLDGGEDEILHIVEVILDEESQSLKIDQVW